MMEQSSESQTSISREMADRVELDRVERMSNMSEPEEDFTITYMRSQTSYYHRFIRFKNVDDDR